MMKNKDIGVVGIMLYFLFYLQFYSQACSPGQVAQKDPITGQVTCIPCQSGIVLNGICLGGGGTPQGTQGTQGALKSAADARGRAASALERCDPNTAPGTRADVLTAKDTVVKKEQELNDQQKKCNDAKEAAETCHKQTNVDCTPQDNAVKNECGEKLNNAIKALNDAVAELNRLTDALEKACGISPGGRGSSCVISKPSISNKNNHPNDYLFLFTTVGLLLGGILLSLARYYKKVIN